MLQSARLLLSQRRWSARARRKFAHRLPGVKNAEAIIEKEGGITIFEIENDPDKDVRKQIFFEMARNSWPIIEMKSMDPTLEEIFLQVTSTYQSGRRG